MRAKFKKALIAFVYAMFVAVLFTGCNRYEVTQTATSFDNKGMVLTTLWDRRFGDIIIMKSDEIDKITPKIMAKRKKDLDSIADVLNR
jgi:hypothetical protein